MGFLLRGLLGVFLVVFGLAIVVTVLTEALSRPETWNGLIALAILVGVLGWLWSELPNWLKDLARRIMRRKERRHDR